MWQQTGLFLSSNQTKEGPVLAAGRSAQDQNAEGTQSRRARRHPNEPFPEQQVIKVKDLL